MPPSEVQFSIQRSHPLKTLTLKVGSNYLSSTVIYLNFCRFVFGLSLVSLSIVTFVTPLPAYAEDLVDEGRDELNQEVNTLSEKIDRFFSQERFVNEHTGTRFNVQWLAQAQDEEKPSYHLHYSFHLNLPKTSERLHLIVERPEDEAREWLTRRIETESKSPDESVGAADESLVGLRYLAHKSKRSAVRFKSGVKAKWLPEPFADARARHTFFFSGNELHLIQNVGWREFHGWNTDSNVNFNRTLTPTLLFSIANRGDYSSLSKRWSVEDSVSLSKTFTAKTAGSLSTGVGSSSYPHYGVTDYFVSTSLRSYVHRNWVIAELVPGVNWSRSQGFHPIKSVTLMFEFDLVE